ncbi:50S ribosomal protein L13 [Candidatus Dojkabacteria bacterium]|nr:50S ribosomal protein L13 [Candidatus Dojkabacteria bacterium]
MRRIRQDTTWVKGKDTHKRNWYLADAKGQTLGRLATKIATILTGKHKPDMVPNLDQGDGVVVINAKYVRLSSEGKLENKIYRSHTRYPTGLKEISLGAMLRKSPEEVIKRAVKGMLPVNKLRDRYMTRLSIFAEAEHDKQAQKPEPIDNLFK